MDVLTERAGCDWLREAAAHIPTDQAIVEIGTYRGGSLLHLALGAREGDGAPCYGVDPWCLPGAYPDRPKMRKRYVPEDQQRARQLLDDHGLFHVALIRDFSFDAAANWTGPKVGLLYIDSIHREPNVLDDFRAWERHLAPNAVVALDDHDERFDGVRQAVTRLVAAGHIAPITLIGSRLAVTRAI